MKKFLSASDETLLRNKIGMVLFAVETSVGDDVKKQFPELSARIAASFFQDLIDLAVKAFAGTNRSADYSRLKEIVSGYNACEIRNAVSHPNRGVNDNTWFRAAALASDPIIDKLGFAKVSESLAAACEEKLVVPPDHWFARETRAIANTLPSQADYDATGFIGRKNDLKKLFSLVQSRRSPAVAVVGPGGSGKTALALYVLNELIHDTSARAWCDGVVYISAKTEELTADGVRSLDVNASIANVLIQITSLAGEINCQHHFCSDEQENAQSGSLVICVDNFETVLAEDPDAIEKLNNALPPTSKLLLTSRVPVDGATTLSLGNMQEGDAIGLAGRYAERVAGTELPLKTKQTIATLLCGSPLAIKLAVDLYSRGLDIDAAAAKAKANVVGFSFTNLIDRLSEVEIRIVEALFLADGSLRVGDLVGILSENREHILQAVTSLSRTSLITREHLEGGDAYSINENIRSLVRKDPRHLKMRPELHRRIRERAERIFRHDAIQKGHEVPEHDEFFVDSELPTHLKDLLIHAVRIVKRKDVDRLGGWFDMVDQAGSEISCYAVFHYFHGRMLFLAGDVLTAVKAFRQALDIQPGHVWSRLLLAECLLHTSDPASRKEAPRELELVRSEADSWPDREHARYWSLFYSLLERAENWTQLRHTAALQLSSEPLRAANLHVTYAAYSECKIVANAHWDSFEAAQNGIENALVWLMRIADAEHINHRDLKRILIIFKECAHFFEVNLQKAEFEWIHKQLHAISTVLEILFARGYLVDDVYEDVLEWLFKFAELPIGRENPCKQIGWAKHLWLAEEPDEGQIMEAVKAGYAVCSVPRKPDEGKKFFIATCVRTGTTVLCHERAGANRNADLRWIRPQDFVVAKVDHGAEPGARATWWSKLSNWREAQCVE